MALGADLGLVRTYNSQGRLDDDNGDNWRLGSYKRVYSLSRTLNTDRPPGLRFGIGR